jgi:hypothetical protein
VSQDPSSRSQGEPAEVSAASARHNVRLPRFLTGEQIGLGDVVKRVTSAVGIEPCSGCERRAARLNAWMSFRPPP